jgi:uncharacterized membrane protein
MPLGIARVLDVGLFRLGGRVCAVGAVFPGLALWRAWALGTCPDVRRSSGRGSVALLGTVTSHLQEEEIMWIWWIVGTFVAVLLVVAIARLLRRPRPQVRQSRGSRHQDRLPTRTLDARRCFAIL